MLAEGRAAGASLRSGRSRRGAESAALTAAPTSLAPGNLPDNLEDLRELAAEADTSVANARAVLEEAEAWAASLHAAMAEAERRVKCTCTGKSPIRRSGFARG